MASRSGTRAARPLLAGVLLLLLTGLIGIAPAQSKPGGPFVGDPAWIAYQTNRASVGEDSVWLIHPDGTGDHEVVTGLPVGTLLPDWSPDGTKLTLASRGGETEPLYEYDLATGHTSQLFACTGRCLGDDEPAYSHDGRYIAFERYLGPFVNDVPADCGLWVGDRRSGRAQQLTSNPGCDREYYVRWSPDGRYLTYHRELPRPDGSVTTAVYTIKSDGTGERRLTDPGLVAGSPDWSPDGSWIVFSSYPLNVFQSGGDSVLYRMHPDGTGLQRLSQLKGNVRATEPRYTPDGAWILFTAVTPSRRALWAMPANGGDAVVIADKERIYTHATWQP